MGVQRDSTDEDAPRREHPARGTATAGVKTERDSTGRRTEVNVGIDAGPVDPLGEGSEAHYRFRSGDTTTVRLPDGSRLQMVQLEIIPRRREFRLLRGTLWIDLQTHGVVRSVLTTARPFDMRRDVEDVPGVLNAAGAIRATLRYVTVEYALTQNRYWLPRLMAVDMSADIGVLAGLPVRFERSYTDYEVTASATPAPRSTSTAPRWAPSSRSSSPAVSRMTSFCSSTTAVAAPARTSTGSPRRTPRASSFLHQLCRRSRITPRLRRIWRRPRSTPTS